MYIYFSPIVVSRAFHPQCLSITHWRR